MRNEMSWCHCEPTLEEILSDPIIEAVMQADAVHPRELDAMLRLIARGLNAAEREGLMLAGR
jgi:hypothetical protein